MTAVAPPPMRDALNELPLTVTVIEPDTPNSAFSKLPEKRFDPLRVSSAVWVALADGVAHVAVITKPLTPRLRKLARHVARSVSLVAKRPLSLPR